jgi:DNA-binding transcriptional regulator YhcF (GntR family)
MPKHLAQDLPKRPTARRRVVAVLTQEILNNPDTKDFPIASEYQLCRRFGVSRVTIRLALGDLEHQGLIYRRHGKGTFAHGHSKRVHRSLGLLIKAPDALKYAPLVEMIRGAQAAMASLRSSLVLISISPLEWQPEMTRNLGGVIVVQQDVTAEEMNNIKKRNLPFLCIEESRLTNGANDCFDLGLQAAEILNHAAVTGTLVGEMVLS